MSITDSTKANWWHILTLEDASRRLLNQSAGIRDQIARRLAWWTTYDPEQEVRSEAPEGTPESDILRVVSKRKQWWKDWQPRLFCYEMEARVIAPGCYQWRGGSPYPEIHPDRLVNWPKSWDFNSAADGDSHNRFTALPISRPSMFTRGMPTDVGIENGWSEAITLNLRVTDQEILESIKVFLAEQRKIASDIGLEKRVKSIPWNGIEALDQEFMFPDYVLTKAEKQAKRTALKLFQSVK
ncbi:MAG: hypothetical protein R3F19_23575 [Verrucomicrobiales bacterium]